MVSNTEKGRLFQEKCRVALQLALNRVFDSEVSFVLSGKKSRKFDLATAEKDIVVECKAFSWTTSGNIPSAKITHLREAVARLRSIPGPRALLLMMKRDQHSKRRETLAAYFVRLNREILGPVNVIEVEEESGRLTCVQGTLDAVSAGDGSTGFQKGAQNAGEHPAFVLGDLRRHLFVILDWREGRRNRDESPAKRIAALRGLQKIPPRIANLMYTILGFRNEAEYEDYQPSRTENAAISTAWQAILEWAQAEGFSIPRDWRDH